MCNSCWRRKVRNLFQLFHLVKNSTKEETVQSPDRFVSNSGGNLGVVGGRGGAAAHEFSEILTFKRAKISLSSANGGVCRKFERFVGNLEGFAPPPEIVNFRHWFQTAITVFCFALSAKPCKSQSVSNRLTCNCL